MRRGEEMVMYPFFGHQQVKDKYVERMRSHMAADELVRGMGWDGSRGCAIGSTLESYDHVQFERELNIPRAIALLFDDIYESLPGNEWVSLSHPHIGSRHGQGILITTEQT